MSELAMRAAKKIAQIKDFDLVPTPKWCEEAAYVIDQEIASLRWQAVEDAGSCELATQQVWRLQETLARCEADLARATGKKESCLFCGKPNPPSTFSAITNEFICIECVKMKADYDELKSLFGKTQDRA